MTSQLITSHDDDDARIVALVQAYLDADYRWEQLSEWRHLRVGEAAPAIDDAFPEATRFGLLSAWNPQSVPRSDADNRSADQALQFQMVQSGIPCRPAFSSAQDRSWREPSWLAVGMPTEVFDALAQRFGQLGTLWWRRGERLRLRIYAQPPVAVPHHCFVDWAPPSR